MDQAVTRADVEEIVGKAIDKAMRGLSAVIHDFSSQVAERFDKADERYGRVEALRVLEKRLYRLETLSHETQRQTEAEIRCLQERAIEIGARANVRFVFSPAEL